MGSVQFHYWKAQLQAQKYKSTTMLKGLYWAQKGSIGTQNDMKGLWNASSSSSS